MRSTRCATGGSAGRRPRRIILDVVRATDAHPTAAFVYRRVRRRLPRVSLATVYRNLRMLAAEGFLAERADEAGMRFDGNIGPHDHFTCLACRRIYDVPARVEPGARRRLSARTGFEVLDHAKAEKSHAGRFNKGLQQIAGKDPAEAI